jgi:hypothetical protein
MYPANRQVSSPNGSRDGTLTLRSTLLHTINVDIKDIKDGIDNMAHVVTDTAHDTTTLVKTLASMSTQVTEIQIDVKSLQSLKVSPWGS